MQIYIYRNGQQYGPYEEATVSAWSRSLLRYARLADVTMESLVDDKMKLPK